MDVNETLRAQLRTLRLSGVLQTLDTRHRQAVEGQWSYLDFLTRLLEDEVERRAQNQLSLRVRRGQLNTTKTLDGFSFSFNPALNRQKVLALSACDFVREHLILTTRFGPFRYSILAPFDIQIWPHWHQ
jgi:DNA replication protein DnaC